MDGGAWEVIAGRKLINGVSEIMALIKCDECGRDVSDKAESCPNCGNPIACPFYLLTIFGTVDIHQW